ncbi:transcription elongation factor S-II [Entomortierella parvispora]|uniref:Transcription elongation factor n=1 Tax=Entomortierella parvispora TaxID=205924 RepID=A0A9P3LXC4_9FUNG|nr:transcription elongation factor S-II [Entomortierella parvispora]
MGSNVEQDVLDHKKALVDALQKGTVAQVVDLLTQLGKVTISASLLRKTEMGLFVNKLKTHADSNVSKLAKDVVRDWKAQVAKETASTGVSTSASSSSAKLGGPKVSGNPRSSANANSSATGPPTVDTRTSTTSQSQNSSREGSSTASSPQTPTDTPKDRTVRSDGMRIKTTGNDVRDRCIEMLYQALGTNSNAESDRLLKKATNIESIVFKKLSPEGTPSQNYKAKIRSFFMNLRDKNNPKLREAVVDGEVAVEEFCEYTTQDMASAEAKARDREIQIQNMFLAKGAEEQQAETDMFKCGKCKSRKCRYRQMQTRSADEPMTTFVTCSNCGNRWKFC